MMMSQVKCMRQISESYEINTWFVHGNDLFQLFYNCTLEKVIQTEVLKNNMNQSVKLGGNNIKSIDKSLIIIF